MKLDSKYILKKIKTKFLVYNKLILAQRKAIKIIFDLENHMMISLINDYSLFGSYDNEIIHILSNKIDKE